MRTAAAIKVHVTITKYIQDTQTAHRLVIPLRQFLQLNFSFTSEQYFSWQFLNCLTLQAFPVTREKWHFWGPIYRSSITLLWCKTPISGRPRERHCSTLKNLNGLRNLSCMRWVRVSLTLSCTHHNKETWLCAVVAALGWEPQLSITDPGAGKGLPAWTSPQGKWEIHYFLQDFL